MELSWLYKLIILILLFTLSAFFSGSEVALFLLDKRKIKKKLPNNSLIKRYLQNLLDAPKRLLVTILLGNTFVNVAASIVALWLVLDIFDPENPNIDYILTVEIFILTILLIIFGELIPKVWASKYPLSFAKFVSFPLYWISVILFPVAESVTEIIKLFTSKLKLDKTKAAVNTEEISELASLSHEQGALVVHERQMINSVVTFRSLTAADVMTPRVDIEAIPLNSSFDFVIDKIISSGHSRIPLYEKDLDNIIGIVHAKDFLPFLLNPEKRNSLELKKIARKAYFIPLNKKLSTLLREFQNKKTHIAIVVDEYGGTSGLITFEDIIEEIIGEIKDEYDREEELIKIINKNSFLVDAKISIDELENLLKHKLAGDEEEYETLAGLIMSRAGKIPVKGHSFIIGNYKFIIVELEEKRIKKVSIEVINSNK